MPATGIVDEKYWLRENPTGQNVWVRAAELIPGDPEAVHHVLVDFGEVAVEGPWTGLIKPEKRGKLGIYRHGHWCDVFADDAGVLLPEDAALEFRMRYTSYGKPAEVHSRLGLYFHPGAPQHRLHLAVFANPDAGFPTHAKDRLEIVEQVFQWDALAFDLYPYAHYWGKMVEFAAHYPDGSSEVLLSVPNYDFNWQASYKLAEPKLLPAGTRVVHSVWRNGPRRHLENPDLLQALDVMLYGMVRFSYVY